MEAPSLGWLLQSSGAGVRSLTFLPGLLEALQAIRNADTTTVEWSEALKRLVTALDARAIGGVPGGPPASARLCVPW